MITVNFGHHFSSKNLQACKYYRNKSIQLWNTNETISYMHHTYLDDLVQFHIQNLIKLRLTDTIPDVFREKQNITTVVLYI